MFRRHLLWSTEQRSSLRPVEYSIACRTHKEISWCIWPFVFVCPPMKEGTYSLIIILPPVLIIIVSLLVVFCLVLLKPERWIRLKHLVATHVFSDIVTKKTDENGNTKWLLRDIELTDEEEYKISSKVFSSLLLMFISLLGIVLVMFNQLLLIEVSYSCDLDDKRKDCFEYKLWDTKRFSNDPIDCNSTAIQSGTIEVVCYKIVFNAGLAVGASYGTFKISMAVFKMATIAMLMIKQAKTVSKIRIMLALLYVGIMVAVIVVQATSLRVLFVSENLANFVQLVATLIIGCAFVFEVPWKELIALKNAQRNEPEATGAENDAMDPV